MHPNSHIHVGYACSCIQTHTRTLVRTDEHRQTHAHVVTRIHTRTSIVYAVRTPGSCTGRASARGPGRAGPQPMGWAGLQLYFAGRAGCGPGLVNNNFADCGPRLGLTFLGLGRARAYSEGHSCFNIMVKYYPQLSIAIRSLFSTL